VKSLDYLFRTYQIDLTVYLHDGKPSVAYSWAQKYESDGSRIEDFGIYADIADMTRFFGNEHQ
jgi:hypothetical protein